MARQLQYPAAAEAYETAHRLSARISAKPRPRSSGTHSTNMRRNMLPSRNVTRKKRKPSSPVDRLIEGRAAVSQTGRRPIIRTCTTKQPAQMIALDGSALLAIVLEETPEAGIRCRDLRPRLS